MGAFMKGRSLTAILIFVFILTSCGKSDQTGSTAEEIKIKDNQRILTGRITEICGNEMVVAEAEEAVEENANGGSPDMPMPSGMPSEGMNGGERQRNRTMYSLTGKEEALTIPVGTTVTTLLGSETTFSRLAVNDMIKIVLETDDDGKETVVAIWIVS